ncbi:cysteine protease family [Plasmopara halstedii]|uniref:Cysteine protease family n=1 Tax=Plasmopara halstedii TaxID=4781 RepID=A0A0P1A578_PLAHL|nr:cysteine protease family [Plasmopara halstedii]CEG35252.1 cysteine protease family [Plasmopara halstedii]|eukprot:XP_024571621.1 cysteine protease family [Plasmopara halstedii]
MLVPSAFFAIAAATLVVGRPMHAGINYTRYLKEIDTTQAELDEWRSKFGDVAQTNGWMPVSEARSTVDQEEDFRQRLFMTKQSIASIQAENPDANFSIMSPFSLLTDEEFQNFVLNAYVRGNFTEQKSRQLRSSTSPDTKIHGIFDSTSLISTAESLINSVISFVQPTSDGATAYLLKGTSESSKSFKFSDFWKWVPQTPTRIDAQAPIITEDEDVIDRSESLDWTESKCVAPIQAQGSCGSCWSFATVSVIESAQCIANGGQSLTKYSEQQLVNCDKQNRGCNGGSPNYAFDYVQKNGLCMQHSYPYTGYVDSCRICEAENTGLKGFSVVSGQNGLLDALTEHPVIVAVASGNNVWKQYTGGIVSSCGTTRPDHAVVAVGFDSSSIKVRNSWGTLWGEGGYIRLARSSSTQGTCGMLVDMTTPQM